MLAQAENQQRPVDRQQPDQATAARGERAVTSIALTLDVLFGREWSPKHEVIFGGPWCNDSTGFSWDSEVHREIYE